MANALSKYIKIIDNLLFECIIYLKAMKRDSRYLEVLQRIPLAEKGCRERYSDGSEI